MLHKIHLILILVISPANLISGGKQELTEVRYSNQRPSLALVPSFLVVLIFLTFHSYLFYINMMKSLYPNFI